MNFAEMISWLREEFTRDGYDVSDIYEEDPYLPIDLCCTKVQGVTREYYFVIVASVSEISEEFQKLLFFYQYYLPYHYKPSEYKIVLAIPASATVVTTPFYADEEEEKGQDFYKVNGFGLWKITDKGKVDKETCCAITLRDKIAKDFSEVIAKEDRRLMKKTTEILPFVDRYIHDSVLGIVGYYPIKFEKRYIDPKLLEKALNLKEVPYKERLFDLINEHLSKKTKSDFDFCTDTFNKLWSEYFNVEIYPEEHRKLEPLLIELYPKYRDHYLHQFQVFLLGASIIDILIHSKKIHPQNGPSSVGWLLAASFHDFAYPIQEYDDYVSRLFNESLGTVTNWGFIGLKNDYTENSFSAKVEHILASLANCFTGNFEGGSEINNFNIIRQFFYHRITKDKNHGLIGSIGLLKKFEGKDEIDFANIILPAAVAIALHDRKIYQPMHGSEISVEHECVSLVQKLAPLNRLDFDMQPLAFLLILCDNVQDWGRHFKDEALERQLEEANIRLKDLTFDSGKLAIQLSFSGTRESRKFMDYKKQVLGEIEKLLNSSNIGFVIEYWDREKNEPTNYKFKIGGSN